MTAKILVVDDEIGMRMGLQQVLKKEGYTVETAGDGDEALKRLDSDEFDAVVTDLRMPKKDGFAVLDHAKTLNSQPLVFMVTAYGDVPTAVKAMQAGAADFILKPFKIDDVRTRVKTALIKRGLNEESPEPSASEPDQAPESGDPSTTENSTEDSADANIFDEFPNIISRHPSMAKILKTVRKIAPTSCTALVLGESGTGKELIAQALHTHSKRADKPFIATASLTESIVESELFGHKAGAFTGARADKAGLFEAADGGTLFLDEVGDLSPKVQVKLLRVIQEGEITRVGEATARKVNVRLIAATWKDLKQEVAEKRFREDLYYRLNVIPIELPPLRERGDDLERLTKHFLAHYSQENGREVVPELLPEAVERLKKHDWRGNVRELMIVCNRLTIFSDGEEIDELAVELALEGDV